MHQCASCTVAMDTLGHSVEVVSEAGAGQVRDRNPHTLHPLVGGAGVVERGVNDQGDAFL